MQTRNLTQLIGITIAAALTLLAPAVSQAAPDRVSVIVQAETVEQAAAAVDSVGGEITHRLAVIRAVGALLDAAQMESLESSNTHKVRLFANRTAETAGKGGKGKDKDKDKGVSGNTPASNLTNGQTKRITRWGLDTGYAEFIDADKVQSLGIDGTGVTIAILDTGVVLEGSQIEEGLGQNAYGESRVLARYNAIDDSRAGAAASDGSGHGTHVSSVAASSVRAKVKGQDHKFNGIAPNANLVIVKAFGTDGRGTYLDVIRGVDWVVANKDLYGIRVLNLSFSAEPISHYWDDPLNQAVMAAWQAGIVVVASAGNRGPDPMTIGVPGNVPYVITVGAMSDAATRNPSDDFLTSFSSTGPTLEGFVKPEVVAPGGHMTGLMSQTSQIALEHPEFHDGVNYFTMSGTSQAAAVVSGVAALMLQYDPTLTPDDVKCRLMASARPATEFTATLELVLSYSVFQQGAGLVNARDAVYALDSGCANRGLDVELDLAGKMHFGGLGNRDEAGNYFLTGLDGDGFIWNDTFIWNDGVKFRDEYIWNDGFVWNDSIAWNGDYAWSDTFIWNDAFIWSDTFSSSGALDTSIAINVWVEQE